MGAFAISLSTAYAIGHVMGLKHCMHRGGRQAKGFYGIYAALIVGAAAIVLIPGSPLGLHTLGVQVLAGCCPAPRCSCCYTTTRPSLGPWANRAKTSIFTATIVAILITLSVILAASVMFPSISACQITEIITGYAAAATVTVGYLLLHARSNHGGPTALTGQPGRCSRWACCPRR